MELKFGNHRNRTFQKEWNEYGEENFVFEALSELIKSEEENINYNKELKTQNLKLLKIFLSRKLCVSRMGV